MLLLANATVVTFEPSRANLFYLTSTLTAAYERHPEWAGRLTLYPIAAGAKRSNATLYTRKQNAGHTVLGHREDHPNVLAAGNVQVYPLDVLLPGDAAFDVMKVDAEGAECTVSAAALPCTARLCPWPHHKSWRLLEGSDRLLPINGICIWRDFTGGARSGESTALRGAVRYAAFEVSGFNLEKFGCSAVWLAGSLSVFGFHIKWPLASRCGHGGSGCDVVVPWGAKESCRWRRVKVNSLPDSMGQPHRPERQSSFDWCI